MRGSRILWGWMGRTFDKKKTNQPSLKKIRVWVNSTFCECMLYIFCKLQGGGGSGSPPPDCPLDPSMRGLYKISGILYKYMCPVGVMIHGRDMYMSIRIFNSRRVLFKSPMVQYSVLSESGSK